MQRKVDLMRAGIQGDTIVDIFLSLLRAGERGPDWSADLSGVDLSFGLLHAWVKAQIIAHHDYEFLAGGDIEQFAQALIGGRDRFFNEHVPTAFDAGANAGNMDSAR